MRRTGREAGRAFLPACCADHVCGHSGAGRAVRTGRPAGRGAGAGLRPDAGRPPEPAPQMAGLRAGPAVLAERHRGAVPALRPPGRRAGAALPRGGVFAGRRRILPHPEPPGAALFPLGDGRPVQAVAAAHRAGAQDGAGGEKSFEKAKKRLSYLAGMV